MASAYRWKTLAASISVLMAATMLAPTPAYATPPVPQPGLAAIFGIVTTSGSTTFDPSLARAELHRTFSSSPMKTSVVAADGSYSFNDIVPGDYYVFVTYSEPTWGMTAWSSPGLSAPTRFNLVENEVAERNVVMQLAATVSGTVTAAPGGPLIAPHVRLSTPNYTIQRAVDPVTGAFTIIGVPAGTYSVRINDPQSIHNDSTSLGGALVVEAGATVTLAVQMRQYTAISGYVYGETDDGGTAPVQGAFVEMRVPGSPSGSSVNRRIVTDATGHFMFTDAIMGLYAELGYELTASVPDEVNTGSWVAAPGNGGELVYPVDGQLSTEYDITLARGGTITGRVMESGMPDSGRQIYAQRVDSDGGLGLETRVQAQTDGVFTFKGLAPGEYILKFFSGPPLEFAPYWNDAWSLEEADRVEVVSGQTVALGDVERPGYEMPIDRIAGEDRFATSVLLSREQFDDGADVPVVYLVNGLNFPDALTAGPAAIKQGGGMLLVTPDGLPSIVANELERLAPDRVVVVGSTATIGASVVAEVKALLPSADVDRLGGSDRYATASLVIKDAFAPGFMFLVATGANFPDALAAAPLAGRRNSPVVIVPGQSASLTPELVEFISTEAGGFFQVVGGEPSVSAEVALAVATLVNPEHPPAAMDPRFAGGDRYSTAALLNRDVPDAPSGGRTVYLATGMGFADALAAGPLVGKDGDVLLLVAQNCIPTSVYWKIAELSRVSRIVLVGGEASLGPGVASLTQCP